MRARFSSSVVALLVLTSGCGSSDTPSGDEGDSSVSDSAVVDTGRDSTSVDSGRDSSVADSGHDTAVVDSSKSDSATVDASDSSTTDSTSDDTSDATVDDTADTATTDTIVDDTTVDDTTVDDTNPDAGPGCTSDLDCAPGQFCDGPTCTGPGTCASKPGIGVFCRVDPDPSCGCNGTDYTSACAAHKSGIRIAHYGACSTTACNDSAACKAKGSDYYCSFGVGYCTTAGFCKAEGTCPGVLSAYCSCAGTDVSTNTCLADHAGTRLDHLGACP